MVPQPVTPPVRIAFPPIGGGIWTGGQNWLANLIHQLMDHCPDRIAPVMFVDADYAPATVAVLESRGVEIVRAPQFALNARRKRLAAAVLTGTDQTMLAACRAHKIDVLFQNADYHGWRFPVPTLSWFPDFQHRHLPHMFGRAAWWRRDIGFRLTLARGGDVLLSSQDAKSDLKRFYSWSKAPVHVVPFAVPTPERLTPKQIDSERRAAGLPARWLFLPNHFWQHKNHRLAVAAMDIARQTSPDIVMVCTGGTEDPRNPGAFRSLQNEVKRLGMEQQVRLMGLVPYSQVKALMQGAVALVNPSLFEGWSTTVEEAKASGTPMILSDLPVHLEQAADTARFFRRDSAPDLADALVAAWTSFDQTRPEPVDNMAALISFVNRFASACEATAGRVAC